MDKMNEVEVLTYLIALLYHYDVAIDHDDPANFDDTKWGKVRDMALDFFQSRLGETLTDKLLREFYKQTI